MAEGAVDPEFIFAGPSRLRVTSEGIVVLGADGGGQEQGQD
jgi:hypothetical protein